MEPIYEKFPAALNYVVDIIENCAVHLKNRGVKKIFLMASEGTILSGVYEKALTSRGIEYSAPPNEDFPIVRSFIEAVKQDKCTEEIKTQFVNFARRSGSAEIILGCTELPVLYDICKNKLGGINFYDPTTITLEKLQAEFAELPDVKNFR